MALSTNPSPLSDPDNTGTSNLSSPLTQGYGVANDPQSQLDKQMADLDALLQNKGAQVPWFKIAQGFLAPTRTGSFGESLGSAAGAAGDWQAEQEKQKIPLAQARLGLLQSRINAQKETQVKTLLPNLYKTVKNSSGVDTTIFDPQIAQRLGAVTGDPKYLAMIPEENKKNQLQQFKSSLFQMPDGQPGFNQDSFRKLYSIDSKEALDTVKSIPEMRRYGLLPNTGAEGTPFDALAITLEGPFKDQAILLANRYKNGLIKDEDADKMANQLLTASTSHMDRSTALAQANATHQLTNILAQDRLDETKRSNEQKEFERKTKEDDKREEQNRKNEGLKQQVIDAADNTLKAVDLIKNHPGRMSGIYSYDPRQLIPGSKEYDFVHQMEGLKSSVFSSAVQTMRGLGSLSNSEGQKVMTLYGSLNPSMSREAFDNTLSNIVETMNRAKDRAMRQYAPVGLPQVSQPTTEPKVIDFSQMPKRNP